jgi:hypothetical protein
MKPSHDETPTAHPSRSDGDSGVRPESLGRLREHVDAAAREVVRLRRENQQLAQSLRELWEKASEEGRGTKLSLEDDPEELRSKIQAFISAVDHYLEIGE